MSTNAFGSIRLLSVQNKSALCRFSSSSIALARVQNLSFDGVVTNEVPRAQRSIRLNSSFNKPINAQTIKLKTVEILRKSFFKLLHQENHTEKELDELYQLSLRLEHVPYSDLMILFKRLAGDGKIPKARAVLNKIDVKRVAKARDVFKLAEFAVDVDAMEVLSKIASKYYGIKDAHSRYFALKLLRFVCFRYYTNGNYPRVIESWVVFVTEIFEDGQVHHAFQGKAYRDDIGELIQKTKLTNIGPIVEKYLKNDLAREYVYRTIIRSTTNTRDPELLYQLVTTLPDHVKEVLPNSVFRRVSIGLACLNGGKRVRQFLETYGDRLENENLKNVHFYMLGTRATATDIYNKCLEIDREQGYCHLPILRQGMQKCVRSLRLDHLENLIKIYHKHHRGTAPYHCYMEYYLLTHDPEKFFETFRSLFEKGLRPTDRTYSLVFRQFAAKGDLESCFALIDYLMGKHHLLNIDQISYVLDCCSNKIDVDAALKIDELVDKLNLKRNGKYYSKLMSVYTEANLHDKALKIYENFTEQPTMTMHACLIKVYVRKGDFESARSLYQLMIDNGIKMNTEFYAGLVEYFCKIGEFFKGESVLKEILKDPAMDLHNLKPFEVMMKQYLNKKRISSALGVYNKLVELNVTPSPGIYHLLMRCLIRLTFIDKTNYSRPGIVAEDLIATHSSKSSKPFLSFRAIKPLVNFLARHYDPTDALALLNKYKSSRPDTGTARTITILKQELTVYGESGQWDRFNAVFQNFLEELKSRMVRGKRPFKAKDVFLPIIGYKAQSGALRDEQLEIRDLLENFVLAHKFTVNNKNLNELALILLSDFRTFEYGMWVVEHKLMGGFIANAVLKGRVYQNSILPLGAQPLTYQNQIKQPRLYLRNESYLKLAVHMDNYLSAKLRADPNGMDKFMEQFRIKFPKVFKNFKATISNFAYIPGYEEKQKYRESMIGTFTV